MTRRDNERGSGLLPMIGIIAALAIMAASLVVLMSNTMANSANDRAESKAFNVAEAALDVGMADLAMKWPAGSGVPASFTTTEATEFRNNYPAGEFPAARDGRPFITLAYYDDQEPLDTTVTWDANGNEEMVVVAQSAVGDQQSRVQARVIRTYFDAPMPRGVPVYTASNLYSNGHGNNPKIHMTAYPPPGGIGTVYAGGTMDYNGGSDSVYDPSTFQGVTGGSVPSLEQFFPQSLIDQVVLLAKLNNRYFTSEAAALASPANDEWAPAGGMSGLCVIQQSSGVIDIGTGNSVLNSPEDPGLLMVLGGADMDMSGCSVYYGVIYCDGTLVKATGTADFYGMVICKEIADLRGTMDVHYDDRCIVNLLDRWTLTVKLVPNTWRELKTL